MSMVRSEKVQRSQGIAAVIAATRVGNQYGNDIPIGAYRKFVFHTNTACGSEASKAPYEYRGRKLPGSGKVSTTERWRNIVPLFEPIKV
jgi:hypothetical protein